ncbi:hypothetical protein GE061_007851, partial [Apolygus lucorum]
TPYWQAGAEKQFYISKKCATKKQTCEKTMRKTLPFCTHVWYEDWRCSECCGGDRCKLFHYQFRVFLSSQSADVSSLRFRDASLQHAATTRLISQAISLKRDNADSFTSHVV